MMAVQAWTWWNRSIPKRLTTQGLISKEVVADIIINLVILHTINSIKSTAHHHTTNNRCLMIMMSSGIQTMIFSTSRIMLEIDIKLRWLVSKQREEEKVLLIIITLLISNRLSLMIRTIINKTHLLIDRVNNIYTQITSLKEIPSKAIMVHIWVLPN